MSEWKCSVLLFHENLKMEPKMDFELTQSSELSLNCDSVINKK